MKRLPLLHQIKRIYIGCVLVSLALFFVLGRDFFKGSSFLNPDSLQEIRDSVIDGNAFFWYILPRRLVFAGTGVFLWRKGYGRAAVYGLCAAVGGVMGGCLYACVSRYYLKGLFLWFLLYFPHMLFYAAALLCVLPFCTEKTDTKAERLRLLSHFWWALAGSVVLCGLGIYLESHVNTVLLQDFLQFF